VHQEKSAWLAEAMSGDGIRGILPRFAATKSVVNITILILPATVRTQSDATKVLKANGTFHDDQVVSPPTARPSSYPENVGC
jgi:hypothetical protein